MIYGYMYRFQGFQVYLYYVFISLGGEDRVGVRSVFQVREFGFFIGIDCFVVVGWLLVYVGLLQGRRKFGIWILVLLEDICKGQEYLFVIWVIRNYRL